MYFSKCVLYRTRVSNMKLLVRVFLVILAVAGSALGTNKLEEKFRWTQIDFDFADAAQRQKAIDSREFIVENNIPFGVEVWRQKVFVTIPRRSPGVVSTLNYVDLKSNNTSPPLKPYPNWESNRIATGSIISTYRVYVDACDRLWTIDSGAVVDFNGAGQRYHAPRIRIFDLKTDKLIREYELKPADYICDSTYTTIIAEVSATACQKAYSYSADPGSNALLVYSFERNESRRYTHPYFNPDPFQMDYKIGSLEFQWDDGIFGFALGEPNGKGQRNAYFHPMSSLLEFVVSTEVLKSNLTNIRNEVKVIGARSSTFQAAASAYDESVGVLFYSLVNKNGIGCWNTKKQSNSNNNNNDIVTVDDERMIYSSDVKVDKSGNLWCISNRLPVILYGNTFNPKEYNFRILSLPVRQAIKNTNCEHNRSFWSKKV